MLLITKVNHMATISVSVPDELRNQILEFDEVNWSAVARKSFEEKIKEMQFLKQLASKSKLTEKDADDLSKKIHESMAKRFRGMK